jgi:hypothetical protein
LTDGRVVFTPLAWYPIIERATARGRSTWRLIGGGRGVTWPDLDMDLSVAGMLAGVPNVTLKAAGATDSAEHARALRRVLSGRTRKAG